MGADGSSNISCYAAWSPSGSGFAVPTRTNGMSTHPDAMKYRDGGTDERNRYHQ